MTEIKKVVLILLDGLRPDGFTACGSPFAKELLAHSAYTLKESTVMPSVTLPCHFSLFHSVSPQRHGILSNLYTPQVRPIRGLFEVLRGAGKSTAMFYDWDELRDLARPDNIAYSCFASGHLLKYENTMKINLAHLLEHFQSGIPDFTFFYMGWVDAAGHDFGWMSDEYLRAVAGSLDSARQVIETLSDDCLAIVTADHGGHDRCHGCDIPEDMTIPLFFYNKTFTPREIPSASIIDIAPTITSLLNVPADGDWEGKPLI